MTNGINPSGKKSRTRSPAYPAIDLEEAINKTSALWKRASRHSVQAEAAVTFWGYERGSSSGLSALSALKKFGLIEDSGSGEHREVKLSDLGIALVFNPDTNSESYSSRLKEAALLPTIHAELWQKYAGQLPDDTIVERYLVVERKFNEQYVSSFINEFKKTISFSKLNPGDMVGDFRATSSVQAGASMQISPSISQPKQSSHFDMMSVGQPPAAPAASTELPIPLDDGRVARVPYPMSEDTFDLLVDTLKLWKRRLVKKADPPIGYSSQELEEKE